MYLGNPVHCSMDILYKLIVLSPYSTMLHSTICLRDFGSDASNSPISVMTEAQRYETSHKIFSNKKFLVLHMIYFYKIVYV